MVLQDSDFEAIYHQYKYLVFNLALHYVQNTSDAEDITQEVFIKINSRYYQFNPDNASLKTWITRIAINQSLDFIKSKKSLKRFSVIISIFRPELKDQVSSISHFNHPGVDLEQKEKIAGIFKHINELPDNQKTAIILNKIEDRPVKEVALLMDTTVKAVDSLLSRAKSTLSKKLLTTEGN